MVMPITDRHNEYVQKVENLLCDGGFRAKSDLRNEKIGFKIREHTLQRIPYQLVVGDKEVENNTVAVRTRSGKDLGSMTLSQFTEGLVADIASRGRTTLED